jgi:hypothetical protein
MPFTGYDPATEPADAVRLLVGDTTPPFQLSDAEVQFALDQNPNIYAAAALCARALSARYARRVDTKFETVESKYSQLRDSYEQLARSLDTQAKRKGSLGVPEAGGISRADVESVHAETDRVKAFFRDNLFNNPPPPNE